MNGGIAVAWSLRSLTEFGVSHQTIRSIVHKTADDAMQSPV